MLFNVGLPMNHARKSVEWFNERMPAKPVGKEHTDATRLWTVGEIVAALESKLAASLRN